MGIHHPVISETITTMTEHREMGAWLERTEEFSPYLAIYRFGVPSLLP